MAAARLECIICVRLACSLPYSCSPVPSPFLNLLQVHSWGLAYNAKLLLGLINHQLKSAPGHPELCLVLGADQARISPIPSPRDEMYTACYLGPSPPPPTQQAVATSLVIIVMRIRVPNARRGIAICNEAGAFNVRGEHVMWVFGVSVYVCSKRDILFDPRPKWRIIRICSICENY